MRIRKLVLEDAPAIAELEKRCFSDPWSEKSIASEVHNPLAYWLVAEDGGELSIQQSTGPNEPVGPGRHIESQGLDRRGGDSVLGHDLREGSEEGQTLRCLPHPSVVHMAFAGHVRVRSEDELRLHLADDASHTLHQVFEIIETAVTEAEEAHIVDAQGLS